MKGRGNPHLCGLPPRPRKVGPRPSCSSGEKNNNQRKHAGKQTLLTLCSKSHGHGPMPFWRPKNMSPQNQPKKGAGSPARLLEGWRTWFRTRVVMIQLDLRLDPRTLKTGPLLGFQGPIPLFRFHLRPIGLTSPGRLRVRMLLFFCQSVHVITHTLDCSIQAPGSAHRSYLFIGFFLSASCIFAGLTLATHWSRLFGSYARGRHQTRMLDRGTGIFTAPLTPTTIQM